MEKRNMSLGNIVSFPWHWAVNLERIMPNGMIYVRSSKGGLSHCLEEFTTESDLGDSADALAEVLIEICESDAF